QLEVQLFRSLLFDAMSERIRLLFDAPDYRDFLAFVVLDDKLANRKHSFEIYRRQLGTTRSYLQLVIAKKRHISLGKIPALCRLFKLESFEKQVLTYRFLRDTAEDAEMRSYFATILASLRAKQEFHVPRE